MLEWKAGISLVLALIVAAALAAWDRYEAERLSRPSPRRLGRLPRRVMAKAPSIAPVDRTRRRAA